MIDVFVRAMPHSSLRRHLLDAVLSRLALEDVSPRLICCDRDVTAEQFHYASKRHAAEEATTDWLIILDDDQLPLYRGWVAKAEEIVAGIERHNLGFVAVAGWSVTHEVPKPIGPPGHIEVSDSIGCPMVVRRDALLAATREQIPDKSRADTIITQRLQEHGLTGITADWRYNHVGMALSQVIPQHWMPACPA